MTDADYTKDVEIARLQERIRSLQAVIDKDIIEVRRRLDELNHEHARTMERNKEFIASALFYQFQTEINKWRDEVNKTLANQAGRSAAYLSLIGFFFLLVQVCLHFWK